MNPQSQQLQSLLQRQILRPLELCSCCLGVCVLIYRKSKVTSAASAAASAAAVQESIAESSSPLNPNTPISADAKEEKVKRKTSRMLALCTSSLAAVPHEEACILLVKYKLPNTAKVEMVLPIYADFHSAIVQSDRILRETNSEFLLKMKSENTELRVQIQSLSDMQRWLSELKRYTLLAKERRFYGPVEGRLATNHQWIAYYKSLCNRSNSSRSSPNEHSKNDWTTVSAEFQSKISLNTANPTRSQLTSATDSPPNTTGALDIQQAPNPFLVLREHEMQEFANRTVQSRDSSQNRQLSLKAIKEKWIQDQMRLRESEFTEKRQINVFVGTWNVNGKLTSEDLSLWLLSESIVSGQPVPPSPPPKDHASRSSDGNNHNNKKLPKLKKETIASLPDLYVIGFQELDLSAEAFLLNDSPREDFWSLAIENGLKDYAGFYHKVASKQLVGMLLIIYVKRSLLPHVGDVSADSAGCGIMGMMGNKGGVAIRLCIWDSQLCFINSHLAADSKEVERRNQNYQEIARRLLFQKAPADPLSPRILNIWDSDCLVWFGDLNYRVSLPESDVKGLLNEKRMDILMAYDQLSIERSHGRAFSEFDEAAVQFWPSYKYDPGTNQFDSSEKRRTPSWCDRILWRRGDPIVTRKYMSHLDLVTSDHKPVTALMEMKVKVLLKEQQAAIHQEVMRQLDQFENASLPDASISASHVSFGIVNYWKPVTQSIVLENTGQVIAQFRFIPKLEETHFCKPWLWINPPMSMLLPGEKLKISFTVLIDHTLAPKLNTGEEKLEDILILHLENGKDYFISVNGQYIPTCFGVSLDMLSRLNKSVRESQSDLLALSKGIHGPPLLSVPKELWRMVDYIYHFGLGVENLFLTSGDTKMMESIRECLDTGAEFPLITSFQSDSSLNSSNSSSEKIVEKPQNPINDHQTLFIHSMAESLVRFLEALPISVIPQACYNKCMDIYQNLELSKQLIQQLPSVHYNVFVYLTSFLREIIAVYEGSELTKDNLAMIFAVVLIRPAQPVKEKYSSVLARKSTQFLLHFLSDSNLF